MELFKKRTTQNYFAHCATLFISLRKPFFDELTKGKLNNIIKR